MAHHSFASFFFFSLSVFSVGFKSSHFFLSFQYESSDSKKLMGDILFFPMCVLKQPRDRQESEADRGQMPLLLVMKVLDHGTLSLLSLN